MLISQKKNAGKHYLHLDCKNEVINPSPEGKPSPWMEECSAELVLTSGQRPLFQMDVFVQI